MPLQAASKPTAINHRCRTSVRHRWSCLGWTRVCYAACAEPGSKPSDGVRRRLERLPARRAECAPCDEPTRLTITSQRALAYAPRADAHLSDDLLDACCAQADPREVGLDANLLLVVMLVMLLLMFSRSRRD